MTYAKSCTTVKRSAGSWVFVAVLYNRWPCHTVTGLSAVDRHLTHLDLASTHQRSLLSLRHRCRWTQIHSWRHLTSLVQSASVKRSTAAGYAPHQTRVPACKSKRHRTFRTAACVNRIASKVEEALPGSALHAGQTGTSNDASAATIYISLPQMQRLYMQVSRHTLIRQEHLQNCELLAQENAALRAERKALHEAPVHRSEQQLQDSCKLSAALSDMREAYELKMAARLQAVQAEVEKLRSQLHTVAEQHTARTQYHIQPASRKPCYLAQCDKCLCSHCYRCAVC
jgi:hypothetical protein